MLKEYVKLFSSRFGQVQLQGVASSSNGQYRSFLHWLIPNGGTLILLMLYIGISRTWGAPATSSPLLTSATEINFSGYLADDNGNPLTGNYQIKVAIYDQATGGTLHWGPETHFNVPVTRGNWTLGIGSATPGGVPSSLWSGDRYLQITVGTETLSPRQLIRSVPIAGLALTVPDGSIQSKHLNLQKDTICLSQWTNVTMPGSYAVVPVPGLILNFTLDTPSQVLVWLDGLAKMQQASVGELGVLVYVDGNSQSGSYGTVPDEWFNLGDIRLVDLASGSHTFEVKVLSLNPGIAVIHGTNAYKTCLNYLALGD